MSDQYPIEYGYELPNRRGRTEPIMYPFEKMDKIKASFFIPMSLDDFKLRPNLKTSMVAYKRNHVMNQCDRYRKEANTDLRVTTAARTNAKHGECGVRVWRVK